MYEMSFLAMNGVLAFPNEVQTRKTLVKSRLRLDRRSRFAVGILTIRNLSQGPQNSMTTNAHAADRVSARIVIVVDGTSVTFPRKRLVRHFTNRFPGRAQLAADSFATSCHAAMRYVVDREYGCR
jgi:hypothetical protein